MQGWFTVQKQKITSLIQRLRSVKTELICFNLRYRI